MKGNITVYIYLDLQEKRPLLCNTSTAARSSLIVLTNNEIHRTAFTEVAYDVTKRWHKASTSHLSENPLINIPLVTGCDKGLMILICDLYMLKVDEIVCDYQGRKGRSPSIRGPRGYGFTCGRLD